MNNTVAKVVQVCAVVLFIGAVICGFVLGRDIYGDFSFAAAAIYWIGGFFSALFLYAFGEVIELLEVIHLNVKYSAERLQEMSGDGEKDEKNKTTYPQKNGGKGYSLSEMAAKTSDGGWVCAECGTKNDVGAMLCKDCGTYKK